MIIDLTHDFEYWCINSGDCCIRSEIRDSIVTVDTLIIVLKEVTLYDNTNSNDSGKGRDSSERSDNGGESDSNDSQEGAYNSDISCLIDISDISDSSTDTLISQLPVSNIP